MFIIRLFVTSKYREVYADNNASTKMPRFISRHMLDIMETFYANPSSIHSLGQETQKVMNECRSKICKLIKLEGDSSKLIFTSGATESNNAIIHAITRRCRNLVEEKENKKNIITTQIEHASMLEPLEFTEYELRFANVDRYGSIDLNHLESLIDANTAMVCIIMANNEIGTIQDIVEIGNICQKYGIHFHTDMTQVFGKYRIDMRNLPVSSCTMSAHKFYGPKGVGCLIIKDRENVKDQKLIPLLKGGHQEFGYRGGTENLMGVVGMVKALEFCYLCIDKGKAEQIKQMKHKIHSTLKKADSRIIFHCDFKKDNTLYNTLSLSLPVNSRRVIKYMNRDRVFVNVGCACSNGGASKVLKAIGLDDDAINGSMRISLGFLNQKSDADRICASIIKAIDLVEKDMEKEKEQKNNNKNGVSEEYNSGFETCQKN